MAAGSSVRIMLELHADPERIAGIIVEPDGRRTAFAGWMGLMDAIERCRAAGLEPTMEEECT